MSSSELVWHSRLRLCCPKKFIKISFVASNFHSTQASHPVQRPKALETNLSNLPRAAAFCQCGYLRISGGESLLSRLSFCHAFSCPNPNHSRFGLFRPLPPSAALFRDSILRPLTCTRRRDVACYVSKAAIGQTIPPLAQTLLRFFRLIANC
jgi:hypothetical protein